MADNCAFVEDEEQSAASAALLQQDCSTPGSCPHRSNATLTPRASETSQPSQPISSRYDPGEIARGMGSSSSATKSLNRVVALKMVLGNRLASNKDIDA
jgi:hypothetical protein